MTRSTALDHAVLGLFRPWLEMSPQSNNRGPRISAKLQTLDLLSSNLAAVCPQVFAASEPDKTWTVDWSLAGFKGLRTGYPYAGNSAFMENRFDLEILAGPDAERLATVAGTEKASSRGHLNLKLPDDANYICIIARERDGGIVRWSHPVLLETPPFGEPVRITPVIQAADGQFSMIEARGPFSREEASEIRLNKGKQIDLAPIPWTQGPVPMVSGWILNPVGYGTVVLSFRTRDDIELGTQSLQTADYELESMPFWQRFKTPADPRMPGETEKIVLVYKPDYQDRPSTVQLAGVRFVSPQEPSLPEGFHSIGRIPASVGQITLDSLSNRFAVYSAKLGFGLFDLTTGRFSGWIPLPPEVRDNSDDIAWVALAGDRLVWADRSGKLRLVSVSKKTVKEMGQINGIIHLIESPGDIVLSPDGNFIATHGVMAGTRILRISDEGPVGERLLDTPQVQRLEFARDNSALEVLAGSNQYSLPLGAWDKEELKVARAPNIKPADDPESRDWFRKGDSLVDRSQNVTFIVSSNLELPIRLFAETRRIVLPSGVVALDRDKKPFFVSSNGNVVRIDISKFRGFDQKAGR
jgi:hypothetical protein